MTCTTARQSSGSTSGYCCTETKAGFSDGARIALASQHCKDHYIRTPIDIVQRYRVAVKMIMSTGALRRMEKKRLLVCLLLRIKELCELFNPLVCAQFRL